MAGYIPKKPQREQFATMVRCFLVQAIHGEVDRELGFALWGYLERMHPISSMADWVADLNGTGYILDRELTALAHEQLGPVFRIMRGALMPGEVVTDENSWFWLQDCRDLAEFRQIGQGAARVRAYIEIVRRRQPDLRARLLAELKPKVRADLHLTPEEKALAEALAAENPEG